LCQYAEEYKKPQIGWGGTGEKAWREAGFQITLRFTKREYRDKFIIEAERLLKNYWTLIKTLDNDPAHPRR
jgi:hypothetical protein